MLLQKISRGEKLLIIGITKEREALNENEMTKKATLNNYKRKIKETEKKTKDGNQKRSHSDERKRSKVKLEESWFCCACKENRVSDMRQCVKCHIWYHEEYVVLTKNDKELIYCQNSDE
ncbi:unnamed protein product [Acanthoscelides obtectus]|uniref:Uncharacterized protein n=1 Tax=Acanthoscelides obtectus TaxID=200917 RepID=A0A9P0PQW3_ACAOB|nr:unnamed protein product [Acanthoscelides obtectus]CAK1663326.1 hypothetical protein AOBTE_LOCUS23612 [Acanthoscelides obtectus]